VADAHSPPRPDARSPEASVPDAASGAGDAAPPDGSVDAGAPDSGPPGFCDGKRFTFCADFDGVRSVADGWTSSELAAGATLTLVPLGAASSARSLRAKVPAGTGPNSTIAVVKKTLPSTLGRTVLAFDCNVSSIGTASGAGEWLLQIARLGHNGTDEAIALYAHSTGTWTILVAAGPMVVGGFELPAPTYRRIVRISIDVVWSPTSGSISIAFDGASVSMRDALVTALSPATDTVDIGIGLLDALGSTPPADVTYDNVTVQQR